MHLKGIYEVELMGVGTNYFVKRSFQNPSKFSGINN
jgi:hypothetical protein